MLSKLKMKQWGVLLISLFWFSSSWAYYSTLATGDILEEGEFNTSVETQFLTDSPSGVNLVGRFDSYLSYDSNFRALVGFGATDFQVGGYYKWVPVPDIDDQPAIGLMAGINFATNSGYNDLALRLHPLISKKFDVDFGALTPYASIPFGLSSIDDETVSPVQLVIGSQVQTFHFEKISFWGEVGFDLNEAFSYISFSASLDFDEATGMVFR